MTTPRHDVETVGELMTGDLIALRPIDNVARAREVLTGSGLHALPVLDEDVAIGVVTLADCEGRMTGDLLGEVVGGIPITVTADTSIADAARVMRDEHIHHLLVTDGRSDETIGILSSFDLLRLLTQ